MDEKPESEKLSHAAVEYEPKSTHLFKRCGNCSMIIRPDRCSIVRKPIAPAGYCIKWEKK